MSSPPRLAVTHSSFSRVAICSNAHMPPAFNARLQCTSRHRPYLTVREVILAARSKFLRTVMPLHLSLGFIFTGLLLLTSGGASANPLIVSTTSGTFKGHALGSSVIEFLGIPYGTAARWEKPKPCSAHGSEIQSATTYGKSCIQDLGSLQGILFATTCE